jgi:hypothetical protein
MLLPALYIYIKTRPFREDKEFLIIITVEHTSALDHVVV